VKEPAEALVAARRAAAASAAGATSEGEPPPWSLDDPAASARRLAQWAIIEPEQAEVYSTRRLGRPITALKRLQIRFLQQYLGQISAQQSRFNAEIAAHVMRLEERVAALEQTARERDQGDSPHR
jgi:hypothetical protein